MTMEWYDWVRLYTSVISFSAMYFLGRIWISGNLDRSRRMKDFWWSINAMLLAIGVGTIEQILRDRPSTWSLIISVCATTVFLKATYRTYKMNQEQKT